MELYSQNIINFSGLKMANKPKKEELSFAQNPITIKERKLLIEGIQREIKKNEKELMKELPWFVRLSNMFKKDFFKGDVANVIITGLGTGLVAPLMINYNPLSKEDSDTKAYAAWRQPISAVIAVVTQVGITKQVEKTLKGMATEGRFGEKMNLRIANMNSSVSKKCSAISDEFAFLSRKNNIDLNEYFKEKSIELFEKAGLVKEKLPKRAELLKKRADGIKELINNPEKAGAFLSEQVKKYSDKAKARKSTAGEIEKRFKNYKDNLGIGIALITLPFACGLLNWVYPRFMKAVFPELTNKKGQTPDEKETKPKAEELKA